MRKLTLADISFPAVYEEQRDAIRRDIIAMKRDRRVSVGDCITVVFENRDTVRFQIQEMCRVEGITDQAGIQQEVNVYNDLIPGAGELSATLMIEVSDQSRIAEVIDSFLGLNRGDGVRLEYGDTRVVATFDIGPAQEERISAVQYLRFRFTPEQVAAFHAAATIELVVDHPGYVHRTSLASGTVSALKADLAAENE